MTWIHAAAGDKSGCLPGPSRFFLSSAADILCNIVVDHKLDPLAFMTRLHDARPTWTLAHGGCASGSS
jgi:hypothetical protein